MTTNALEAAGQAHMHVGGPLPGRILSASVHREGAAVSLAGNCMRVMEPEFAFRLGADLPPQADGQSALPLRQMRHAMEAEPTQ